MRRLVAMISLTALQILASVAAQAAEHAAIPSAATSASAPQAAASAAPGPTVTIGETRYVLLPVGETKPAGGGDKAPPWWGSLVTLVQAHAWPLFAYVMLRRLLKSPPVELFLSKVFERTTDLKVFGWEIKLSEGAAASLDDVRKLMHQVPDTHKDWVANSHITTQFQAVVTDVKDYLATSQCDSGTPLPSGDFAQFRFTLHVPDVLLAHSFRQLVNYVGFSRGGAGRLFSTRIGIIGKAWRSGRSEFVANTAFTDDELIERWGMTRAEAQDTSRGKKIFLAVLLCSDQGLPLAVFYCDAANSQLFDAARCTMAGKPVSPDEVFQRFARRLVDASKARGLTASLATLEDARVKVEQIDFYEERNA